VLVTGAAGFIGSHVAHALAQRGLAVIGIDNFDAFYSRESKRENLSQIGARFRFIEADICDEEAMRAVFERERPGGVIHLAARAGVRPSIEQPVLYARVNVVGTMVVLHEAARAGCSRVVCASSSSVYGNNPKTPFAETDSVDHPISPYAATKKACELLGHAHHHLTGMPTAMLRFFTVFGPRQRPDLAISLFMGRIARGEAIPVFGDGSTSRDYTYIDDVVAGVMSAYERVPAFGYRIWNLGGNRPVPLSEMIATIERVVGGKALVDRRPMPAGDVERTYADLTRSASELGFRPTTLFEAGVARQWEWMRSRMGRGG
jgi:UDP-glucuronate 4-epimerase